MRPPSYGHIQKIGIIAVLVESVFLMVFAAAMAGPSTSALVILLLLLGGYLALVLYQIGRILRQAETGALPEANAGRIMRLLAGGAGLGALGAMAAIAAGPQGAWLVLLGLVPQLALLFVARYRLAGQEK